MISGLVYAAAGVACVVTGLLARRGRLPRNRWVGMRTRATMRSDASWRAAHTASAWSLLVAGGVLVVAGAIILGAGPDGSAFLVGPALVATAVVVVGGVQAERVARRVEG